MTFRADLHTHTNCSDGTLTPEGLLRHARDVGLQGLAITDHDTLEAYAEVPRLAEEMGIEWISGIELSSVFGALTVHVLGYAFSLESEALQLYCRRHVRWRRERNQEILDKLTAQGYPLTEQEMVELSGERGDPETTVYGRPHIAMALVAKGFVSTVRDAFNHLIGDRSPCYAAGLRASVEEAIEVIHRAGGLAVIAHPHVMERGEAIIDLLELPFDGIEGYYARFPKEIENKWIAMGQKRSLLITGGSDFHGSVKPHIPLGCSWVGQSVFRELQQHFQRQK